MGLYRLNRTGTPVEAASFTSSSATFGSSVRAQKGGVTLLVSNDAERGLVQYVITPDSARDARVAGNAASAVGARAERVDDADMPNLDTPVIAHVVARPDSFAARETQAGADPHQIAQYLAPNLPQGCWVAVTARGTTNIERTRMRRWYDHRLGNTATHHSRSGEVVAASIWAGGEDFGDISSIVGSVVATMPGFDVETVVRRPAGRAPFVAVCLLMALAVYVGVHGTTPIGPWWHGSPKWHRLGYTAMSVLGAFALGWLSGLLPTPSSRVHRAARHSRLPMPKRRHLAVRRPRTERMDANGTIKQRRFDGDYPMARDVFFVGPSVVLGLVSPHTGEATDASRTRMRQVPSQLRLSIGPMMGHVAEQAVHISMLDRFGGVGLFGMPGTGKSVVVNNIFAVDCALKVRGRTGAAPLYPGDVGANNTLVVFENKGRDGVAVYQTWATKLGDDLHVIEAADATTPCIDMFPASGTPAERSAFFVDSMVYAFGDTSIQSRSQETFNSVIPLALLTIPADITAANTDPRIEANPLPANISIMELIHVLLGGRGDAPGCVLVDALTLRATAWLDGTPEQQARARELKHHIQMANSLYGVSNGKQVTQATREKLFEAPRNKIAVLLRAGSWWDRSRVRVGWDAIITRHESVVVNTGQATNGTAVDQGLTKILTSMMTYGLQKAIERNCSGWAREGRAVSIYSDELGMLAGVSSSEVLQWLRNQGRSFGIRNVYATQFPEQLEENLRKTITGFSTFLWLTQADTGVAKLAADDLSGDGTEWNPSDIITLQKYHGVLRASVGSERQPCVPIKIAFYGDAPDIDVERFLVEQGIAA